MRRLLGSRERCRARLPAPRVVELAVERLRGMYPQDPIEWKGGGRGQAEQAIAAARWAFRFSRGQPCHARKLAAAAALFYEIITLHPLVDGNKRLAVVVLGSFLIMNSLPTPRPGSMYRTALRVAGGEWSQEDVHRWLLGVYRARRKRGG